MSDSKAKAQEENFMDDLNKEFEDTERRETVDNFKADHILDGNGDNDEKRNLSDDLSSIMPGDGAETNYRPNDSMASLADMMGKHGAFGNKGKVEANSKVPGLNLDEINKKAEGDVKGKKGIAITQRIPSLSKRELAEDDNILSKSQ